MDLVDQMHVQSSKAAALAVLRTADPKDAMSVIRDLTIEQMTATIKKFPLYEQKCLLAVLTHNFLCDWHEISRDAPEQEN